MMNVNSDLEKMIDEHTRAAHDHGYNDGIAATLKALREVLSVTYMRSWNDGQNVDVRVIVPGSERRCVPFTERQPVVVDTMIVDTIDGPAASVIPDAVEIALGLRVHPIVTIR